MSDSLQQVDRYDHRSDSEESRSTARRPVSGVWAFIREVAFILVAAVVISTLLRMFIFQVFWVPSASMRPTLMENDRIVASRISAWTGDIERGDVVVFSDENGWISSSTTESNWLTQIGEFTGLMVAGNEETLVKRVIGVGGDTVTCCTADGNLTVNGVELNETYLSQGIAPSTVTFSVTVPEGYLWVMGDNRSNSADSRYHMSSDDNPFVAESAVVGHVTAVVWPFDRWSTVNHREVFADVPDANSSDE